MRRVYVAGIAETKREMSPRKDVRTLVFEATSAAVADAGLEIRDIQQMWVARSPATCDQQFALGQVIVDGLGLSGRAACVTIEEGCTASGMSFHDAYLAVASGMYDIVLSAGVTKAGDSLDLFNGYSELGYNPFDSQLGVMLGYADFDGYARKYGVTDDDIYAWYETECWYATRNPLCPMYKRKYLSLEEWRKLPYRAYPLRYGSGIEFADGAAAAILVSEKIAKKLTDTRIFVAGISQKEESSYYPHTLSYGLYQSPDMQPPVEFAMMHSISNRVAWKEALCMAGIAPENLDIVQPHQGAVWLVYNSLDCLGHPDIPFGYGPKWYSEGNAKPGGKLPSGTSAIAKGGYNSGGDALQYVYETVKQLRENAGERQCPMKSYAGAWMVGASLRPVAAVIRRE